MTHETVKETEGADRRVQAVRETKGVGSGSIRLSDSGSLRIDDLGSVPCECKGAGRATERRDVDQYVVMVLRCLILCRSVLRGRHWRHRQGCQSDHKRRYEPDFLFQRILQLSFFLGSERLDC